jgi:glycosyltransferase involved in cell wall biosynthesis
MPIFELDTFTEQEKSELSKVQIINCTKWAEEVCHKNGLTNTVGIVNLGYDPGIFYPKERPKNDLFTVLNVGKIEIRKTHDLIPDIFSTAFSKADQVSLIMSWGNPFYSEDETNSWHRYYDKKLSGYNVSFIGRTNNQEQLANIMRSADVGLFPARAEGWNLDMLEMMACGKPCVTTNYSGHTEFINNINSLSIKPVEFELAIDGKWFFGAGEWMKITNENIKELARLLQLYYKNWKENSLQNISSTVKNFTWENSAKQLLEILNGNSNFST